MESHLNISKKNISHLYEDKKGASENNASFFKGGQITPLGGGSKNDTFFLKDLSKIELDRSGTGGLISTERVGAFGEKDLEILKGIVLFNDGVNNLEHNTDQYSQSRTTPDQSSEKYKNKINEAFYNSDFANMSQNLHLYQMHEAKSQNSKRKKSQASKENYLKDHHNKSKKIPNIEKLTKGEKRDILQNRDFNFELGQEFLESRYVAYQSKDLKYSLKNAKEIEKSLMQLQLDDSDQGKLYINQVKPNRILYTLE